MGTRESRKLHVPGVISIYFFRHMCWTRHTSTPGIHRISRNYPKNNRIFYADQRSKTPAMRKICRWDDKGAKDTYSFFRCAQHGVGDFNAWNITGRLRLHSFVYLGPASSLPFSLPLPPSAIVAPLWILISVRFRARIRGYTDASRDATRKQYDGTSAERNSRTTEIAKRRFLTLSSLL